MQAFFSRARWCLTQQQCFRKDQGTEANMQMKNNSNKTKSHDSNGYNQVFL